MLGKHYLVSFKMKKLDKARIAYRNINSNVVGMTGNLPCIIVVRCDITRSTTGSMTFHLDQIQSC